VKEDLQKGPMGRFFRPENKWPPIASAYDVVVRITKDPTRSEKAALLPIVIAPKAVVMSPVNTVAGIGQLRPSSTLEKKPENGVALSRARVHQVRPTVRKVPIKQGANDRKMMNKRPKVAPVLPVACA
jgi:hypothetical protein